MWPVGCRYCGVTHTDDNAVRYARTHLRAISGTGDEFVSVASRQKWLLVYRPKPKLVRVVLPLPPL